MDLVTWSLLGGYACSVDISGLSPLDYQAELMCRNDAPYQTCSQSGTVAALSAHYLVPFLLWNMSLRCHCCLGCQVPKYQEVQHVLKTPARIAETIGPTPLQANAGNCDNWKTNK